jgi:hypothetical protein
MTATTASLVTLAKIHNVSESILSRWKAAGINIQDSREIVKKVWASRTTAPTWQSTIDGLQGGLDSNSERYWRREKLKREAEKLELQNAMSRGEMFRREDTDAANMALGSAFKLAIMESQSVLPPQLAGLNEAEIEKVLADHNRRMLSDLSDLSSGLWQAVMAKHRNTGEADPAPAKAKVGKIHSCK